MPFCDLKIVDVEIYKINLQVDKLFGSYDKIYNAYKEVLSQYSDDENKKLFQLNANKLYKIN